MYILFIDIYIFYIYIFLKDIEEKNLSEQKNYSHVNPISS